MNHAMEQAQSQCQEMRQFTARVDLLFYAAYVPWLAYGLISGSFFMQKLDAFPFLNWNNLSILATTTLLIRELVCACERKGPQSNDGLGVASTSMAAMVILVFVCGTGVFTRNVYKLFVDLFFMFAARNIDKNGLIKCSYYCMTICLIVILCASLLDVIPNYMLIQGTRIRYCLGFRYCLVPSNRLFVVTCLWCLMKEERMSLIGATLFLIINYIMYLLTDSRLVFAASIAVVAFFLLQAYIGRTGLRFHVPTRIVRVILGNSTVLCIVVTAIVTLAYGIALSYSPEFASRLGSMFGHRIMRGCEGLVGMGVKMFGQSVSWVGNGLSSDGTSSVALGKTYNYVDNIYLHVLIEQGIAFAAIHFILLNVLSRRAVRRQMMGMAVVIAAIAVCGLLDDHALTSNYNPFILLALNDLRVRTTSIREAKVKEIVGGPHACFEGGGTA